MAGIIDRTELFGEFLDETQGLCFASLFALLHTEVDLIHIVSLFDLNSESGDPEISRLLNNYAQSRAVRNRSQRQA